MKTCTQCKIEKSSAEFSKDSTHKDDLRIQCKSCRAIYEQTPQRREARLRYIGGQQGRETDRRYRQRCRQSNPGKKKAHNIVSGAIRRGKLRRSVFCEVCGLPAETEGHHADYSKPLEINWLCRKCHKKTYKK